MTKKEWDEMCEPDFIWYQLPSGKKIKITPPDKFMEMWEKIIPTLPDHKFKEYMEAALAHTLIIDANPNMAWLYDRLMIESIEREFPKQPQGFLKRIRAKLSILIKLLLTPKEL
jgi:hypothetical protein